jgi:tetratricopeptide (TPR) repeat protein
MVRFSRASGQPSPIVLADRAREARQWDAAVRHYRIALARNPHNPPIWVQYGHALKEGGSYVAAEAAYRRAIADDPTVADTHLQLGRVLKLQDRTEEARAAYLRAFSMDQSLHEAADELAAVGCPAEDLPQLLRDIPAPVAGRQTDGLAAGSRRKRRKESIITRADRARDLGQWETAAQLYRQALDRNPGNPSIWVQYGHALKEAGQRDAELAYRQALASDPHLTDAHLQLGQVLKQRGNTEAAQQAFLRAFALDPSLPHAAHELSGLGWAEASVAELVRLAGADAPDRSPRERSEASTSKPEEAVAVGEGYGFVDNEPAAGLETAGPPPLFSVVIPVYDRTSVFREALDSVLSQSLADFEIIITTDASPPETLAIIEEYKRWDRRVRAFYYSDNSGNAGRGRNRGIIEARGEFISFLDSDDLLYEDTLAKAHDAFLTHKTDVVAGRASWIVDGSRLVGDLRTGGTNSAVPVNMAVLMRNNPFMLCTVHVRHDVLLLHGGFRPEQRYLEDLELWLRLAHRGCTFHYSENIFAKYRLHDGNNELQFIKDKEQWFEVMWENYYKPFHSWGI